MPLPRSRIGKAVLLGIVLGLLAVFAVAAFATVVHAQEPQQPQSSDKDAVGPAIDSPKLRDPEDVACRTATALLKLYPFDAGRDWQNNWMKSLNSDARQLGIYCEERGDLRSDDPEKRRRWILGVRGYDVRFMRLVVEATAKPQTLKSRQRLAKFEDVITELHFDADTLLTWEMLRLAKPTIVEVPKEVIRTVEVPVACPEPQPVASRCDTMMWSSARQWSGILYAYRDGKSRPCGGCTRRDEWDFAEESAGQLEALASSGGDVPAYAVGWLAQYRALAKSIRSYSDFPVDEHITRVAADMRAKLPLCGIQQPDFER